MQVVCVFVGCAQAALLQVGETWVRKSVKNKKHKEDKKEVQKKQEDHVRTSMLKIHVHQVLGFVKMEPRNPKNCLMNIPRLIDLQKIFQPPVCFSSSLWISNQLTFKL